MPKLLKWVGNAVAGNAIWSTAGKLWSLGGGTVITFFVGVWQATRGHLDLVMLSSLFVVAVVTIAIAERKRAGEGTAHHATAQTRAVLTANVPNNKALTSTALLQQPSVTVEGLILIDFVAECKPASDAGVTYKSKIRVFFRNDSAEDMQIKSLSWASGVNGLRCQKWVPGTLQLEGPMGWESEDWTAEKEQIHLPAGRVFRLWVGFAMDDINRPPEDRCNELWHRHVKRQLGTLKLLVNGKEVPFSI